MKKVLFCVFLSAGLISMISGTVLGCMYLSDATKNVKAIVSKIASRKLGGKAE